MNQEARHIRALIDKLNINTELYDKGIPQITDKEWDDLYFQLNKLEQETGITFPDSPTQSINYTVKTKLDKVIHDQPPMLSLDKTKDKNVISSFVKGHDWFGMFKLDGLSCRLIYENGKLIQASTRGNGIEGEDITHNAMVITNIPKTIPITESIIVDGEVICDWDTFNTKFKDVFANPRNMAAGSIRQLSSEECAARGLSFIAWDLVKGCEDIDFNFRRLEQLDDWGFDTVPRVGDAETISDAIETLDEMKNDEFYNICPIDGYVFKFESKKYCESCGRTEHHFNSALAYKFYDEEYETELLNIEWTMGRTGILSPVAIYEDVEIDGSICNRASLHNLSILEQVLGTPFVGQKIWVYKANQIIPQIRRGESMTHFSGFGFILTEPKKCPICGENTIIKENNGVKTLWCGNPLCEGKLENKIDHYLGKKGLNIKGISKATIGKCIEWGWLNGIIDIYKLHEHQVDWENKPGFGKASVGKILHAIDTEGRCTKLDSFISAISIPLVGAGTAKEITKYYSTWDDFRNAVGGDWTEFEGFGDELNKAINSFDYTEADKIAEMITFIQPEAQAKVTPTAAQGKTFCVTGKIEHFKNRDELKADIEAHGGKLTGSVTSKTDYLITNTPNSGTSKNLTAQKLGVKIITENGYLEMISNA